MAFYDEFSDPTNFVISFTRNPMEDFGVFSKGYALAANRLAGFLLEAQQFSDYEAYPIVFLYRHAIELSLKHIIYTWSKLAAFKHLDEVDRGLQNSHDIKRLSGIVATLLATLFPKDEGLRQAIAMVTKTCHEFWEIDPRSDGYRYPINTEGQRSTKRHQVVNLRAFADRMSAVLEDLDTVHFGLNIETDKAQEVCEAIESLLSAAAKGEEP